MQCLWGSEARDPVDTICVTAAAGTKPTAKWPTERNRYANTGLRKLHLWSIQQTRGKDLNYRAGRTPNRWTDRVSYGSASLSDIISQRCSLHYEQILVSVRFSGALNRTPLVGNFPLSHQQFRSYFRKYSSLTIFHVQCSVVNLLHLILLPTAFPRFSCQSFRCFPSSSLFLFSSGNCNFERNFCGFAGNGWKRVPGHGGKTECSPGIAVYCKSHPKLTPRRNYPWLEISQGPRIWSEETILMLPTAGTA